MCPPAMMMGTGALLGWDMETANRRAKSGFLDRGWVGTLIAWYVGLSKGRETNNV